MDRRRLYPMSKVWRVATAIPFAFPTLTSAHHSEAGLDMQSIVTLEGTVTEFQWRNPHVYFGIDAPGDDGTSLSWIVQVSSTVSMTSRGWSRDTLAVGDRLAITVHPARDGRPYAVLNALLDIDGVDAQAALNASAGDLSPAAVAVGRAATLEGRWLTDESRLGDFPGGLDELARERFVLTDEARAVQAAFDENTAENPELSCLGRPTPAMLIYPNYPLEIELNDAEDIVYIRGQYMDQERVVHLDGRRHPPNSVLLHEGHSIGWWENDILVVDTANFSAHPTPYQNDIPSSARKHVVERYSLAADGSRLIVELLLEDPPYLAEPFSYRRELLYSPGVDMSPFDCNLESTRRYLPQ